MDVVLSHLLEQLICGESRQGERVVPLPGRPPPNPAQAGAWPATRGLLTHTLARLTGGLEELCLDL